MRPHLRKQRTAPRSPQSALGRTHQRRSVASRAPRPPPHGRRCHGRSGSTDRPQPRRDPALETHRSPHRSRCLAHRHRSPTARRDPEHRLRLPLRPHPRHRRLPPPRPLFRLRLRLRLPPRRHHRADRLHPGPDRRLGGLRLQAARPRPRRIRLPRAQHGPVDLRHPYWEPRRLALGLAHHSHEAREPRWPRRLPYRVPPSVHPFAGTGHPSRSKGRPGCPAGSDCCGQTGPTRGPSHPARARLRWMGTVAPQGKGIPRRSGLLARRLYFGIPRPSNRRERAQVYASRTRTRVAVTPARESTRPSPSVGAVYPAASPDPPSSDWWSFWCAIAAFIDALAVLANERIWLGESACVVVSSSRRAATCARARRSRSRLSQGCS